MTPFYTHSPATFSEFKFNLSRYREQILQRLLSLLVIWYKICTTYYHLVPEVSYDLTRLAAQLFESCMSTNSIIRAYCNVHYPIELHLYIWLLGQPATHYLTHSICSRGAGEGPRSLNPIWATDFKSVLYSNSSTPAYQWAVFRDAQLC